MTIHPLISTDELFEAISSGSENVERLVLLDVRWQLGSPNTREEYLAGHLPGAVFVDLDAELADPVEPALGRHPLPSTRRFQEAVKRWGVRDGDAVVVYDGVGGIAATRLWWLLRDAGFANVRLLDGVLGKWAAESRPLDTGDVKAPGDGSFHVRFGQLPTVTIEEAARLPESGSLLDIRAAERYQGVNEPVDPRAGHIPGAVNAPTGENLTADGTFKSPAELRDRFTGIGVCADQSVAVYCGSGVSATHTVLALTIAGLEPALYPGSWSQWSSTPDRPVATGTHP